MQIRENPIVDVWMADVNHYVFKIFSEGKCYEQCKFSREIYYSIFAQVWSPSWSGSLHPVFLLEFFIQIVTI